MLRKNEELKTTMSGLHNRDFSSFAPSPWKAVLRYYVGPILSFPPFSAVLKRYMLCTVGKGGKQKQKASERKGNLIPFPTCKPPTLQWVSSDLWSLAGICLRKGARRLWKQ